MAQLGGGGLWVESETVPEPPLFFFFLNNLTPGQEKLGRRFGGAIANESGFPWKTSCTSCIDLL